MNKVEALRVFLKICEDIRNKGPRETNYGLCTNITAVHVYDYCDHEDYNFHKFKSVAKDHIQELNVSWPESSGCSNTPVYVDDPYSDLPKDELASNQYFTNNNPKYEGEYGEARMRLLDYYIEETRKKLKQ